MAVYKVKGRTGGVRRRCSVASLDLLYSRKVLRMPEMKLPGRRANSYCIITRYPHTKEADSWNLCEMLLVVRPLRETFEDRGAGHP